MLSLVNVGIFLFNSEALSPVVEDPFSFGIRLNNGVLPINPGVDGTGAKGVESVYTYEMDAFIS